MAANCFLFIYYFDCVSAIIIKRYRSVFITFVMRYIFNYKIVYGMYALHIPNTNIALKPNPRNSMSAGGLHWNKRILCTKQRDVPRSLRHIKRDQLCTCLECFYPVINIPSWFFTFLHILPTSSLLLCSFIV